MEYTYIHNHQSRFIEWFGDMKYLTSDKTMSDFFDMKAGQSITAENIIATYDLELFPCYGGNGLRGYVTHYTHEGHYCLIGRQGALCGNVNLTDGKFFATEHAIVVTPKININTYWLFFALSEMNLNRFARGVAQPGLSVKQLETIPFSIPPTEEQDSFERLYRQADKSKFDGFKSRFIEWFGNPFLSPKNGKSVSITDVADIVLGTTPNSKIKEYWDGELKWITPAEIEEESFIISDTVRHITEDGRNSANLTLLPVGSVLFSTRAPIGKVAIAGEEMYCNQGFKNFICKPELNNVFLYYTLRLNKEYLVSLGTGTTFKELSKKIVESIKISVPAKEQQEQFETLYRQADKSKYYKLN